VNPATQPAARGDASIHAGAWAMWLAAVVAALAVGRNPIYLALILAWIAATWVAAKYVAGALDAERAVPLSPLHFGLFVVSVSALFNGLMVHVGDAVLVRLPDALPLIGGPVTLEALLYGALNGLALTGLYAAFILVNQALPVREMVRLAPRAYYSIAVVVSIAAAFVPTTLRQYRQIREAQAVRGQRVQGLRSWLPLLLPLLTGGLERALQLAEAMTARGFAGASTPTHDVWTQVSLIAGIALAAAGLLLRLVWGMSALGLATALVGAALVAGAVWAAGRRHPQTVYRPAPWRMREWAVAGGAVLTAAFFVLPLPGLDRSSLFFYPYPSLTPPGFSLWIGMSTWGLLPPALAMVGPALR